MRFLILNVNRTKKVFDYNLTESVYQNLRDIMDGVVISEDEVSTLLGALIQMTEIRGVVMVSSDHVQESDMECEFSIYTGTEGSEDRELIEITAKDYGENVLGESLIGDIIDGMANCNLYPEGKRRRYKFLNSLTYDERIWAEILDAYFYNSHSSCDGDSPEMLMEFKTSAEIADDLEEMCTMDAVFITRYMHAYGYHPQRKADGKMAWKIFMPVS